MIGSAENNLKLVVMVEDLLKHEYGSTIPSVSAINEKIDLAYKVYAHFKDETDTSWVKSEVIRRFGEWRSEDSAIVNIEGHIPWITQEKKQEWRYWSRYKLFQEKKLSWEVVDGIDKSTDKILGYLEDPLREGKWDRRGMVVGHVQSGKTGSYTGLICKAADAGYKIIIVLAGLHNNLRSQTQMRLDEGFLGYETSSESGDVKKPIGVGHIDDAQNIRPNYVTNRTEKGDFNARAAGNLGISPEERPWLFVVKKNKSVLTNLRKWITNHVADKVEAGSGRKVVSNLPLLIIDDEADNASVDTGGQDITAEGIPDEEHSPTAINSLIRQILHTFERKAYVGYTATPFANIFIHEKGATIKEGPDLFPYAFIHTLGVSSNYIGPAKIFGKIEGNERENTLPLIRFISDHCSEDEKSGWLPPKHAKDHYPKTIGEFDMPDSLVKAINTFLLSCTIRDLRGQTDQHNSMLIHVTRYTIVQGFVHDQVSSYIRHLNQHLSRRIGGHLNILADLKILWKKDFKTTTNQMRTVIPEDEYFSNNNWEEIEFLLPKTVNQILVKEINGTAKDALDYEDSVEGLKIIAIGGDKLSRGLTLEGLSVSYFIRTTKMYDTLMQMGRWFGYRYGYLDLIRLYVTHDLVEWFEHITDAAEELREEFELMESSGSTPKDYGLKVKSHPVLMVTSRLKMQATQSLYLSFSGTLAETVAFSIEPTIHNANYEAFKDLVSKMGTPGDLPTYSKFYAKTKIDCWKEVSSNYIVDFLDSYSTHRDSLKVNSDLLKNFIELMNKKNELTEWTVVLQGGSRDFHDPGLLNGRKIKVAYRENKSRGITHKYSVKRLFGSEEEAIDLTEHQWNAAFQETLRLAKKKKKEKLPKTPNGPSIRKVKGFGANGIKATPEKGLLILALLDTDTYGSGQSQLDKPIVGFGISFPSSHSGSQVKYEGNSVLLGNEYDFS